MSDFPVTVVTLSWPGWTIDVVFFDTDGTGFLAFLGMNVDDISRAVEDMIGRGFTPISHELNTIQADHMIEAFWRSGQPLIKGRLADLDMPGFESDPTEVEWQP